MTFWINTFKLILFKEKDTHHLISGAGVPVASTVSSMLVSFSKACLSERPFLMTGLPKRQTLSFNFPRKGKNITNKENKKYVMRQTNIMQPFPRYSEYCTKL